MLTLDTKRDIDTRIRIERYREIVNNLVIDVISKLTLVRLFLLGYELVYYTSKTIYNSML
jgi:hypothetical protein